MEERLVIASYLFGWAVCLWVTRDWAQEDAEEWGMPLDCVLVLHALFLSMWPLLVVGRAIKLTMRKVRK